MGGLGRIWDVAIAGDGPAGCAAGIACAAHGLDTLIVGRRRRSDPVRPLESLNPLVRDRLSMLDAADALDAACVGSYDRIWIGGRPQPLSAGGDRAWGCHVDRTRFDEAMLAAALRSGAHHVEGSVASLEGGRPQVLTCADGRRLHASWSIDATGRSRKLARLLGGWVEAWSPPLVAWTGILPRGAGGQRKERTSFAGAGDHWIWETPHLGPGRTWTAVCRQGARSAELDRMRARSAPGSLRGRPVGWQLARAPTAPRTILAGDAGGSLDPATGQGVLNALSSGIAAAATVRACLDEPAAAPLHAAAYDDWFASGLASGARQLDALYRQLGMSWHREAA